LSQECKHILAKPIRSSFPDGSSSYYITVTEAQTLTRTGQAKWHGPKEIIRDFDRTMKVTWAPSISGEYGPIVMQVVT
jgi:hypothetical protein